MRLKVEYFPSRSNQTFIFCSADGRDSLSILRNQIALGSHMLGSTFINSNAPVKRLEINNTKSRFRLRGYHKQFYTLASTLTWVSEETAVSITIHDPLIRQKKPAFDTTLNFPNQRTIYTKKETNHFLGVSGTSQISTSFPLFSSFLTSPFTLGRPNGIAPVLVKTGSSPRFIGDGVVVVLGGSHFKGSCWIIGSGCGPSGW